MTSRGVQISFILDIGAGVSVLNKAKYDRYSSKIALGQSPLNLRGYGGYRIREFGVIRLDVRYEGQLVHKFAFHITITAEGANLLGIDLFDALEFAVLTPESRPASMAISKIEKGGDTHSSLEFWRLRYPSIFSGLGSAIKFTHQPLIDLSVQPSMQPLRRLPLATRPAVTEEIHRLEEAGIIERIDSSVWISNLVIATKKSNEIRMSVGLVAVNKAVIPGKHPLPTLDELTAEFNGSLI